MNDHEVLQQPVSAAAAQNGWLPVSLDLSDCAGQNIKLDVVNQPSGWAEIEIMTQYKRDCVSRHPILRP